jgi:hypothetical protein
MFPFLLSPLPHPPTHPLLFPNYSPSTFMSLNLVSAHKENTRYLSFQVWLVLFNMMISSSIHLPANNMISFFFLPKRVCIPHFLHPFSHWWAARWILDWLCNLAIVNTATKNMGVQVSLCYIDFDYFEWISRFSIAK